MELVRGSTLLVTAVAGLVCAGLIFALTLLTTGHVRSASASTPEVVGTIHAPKPPAQANRQISEVSVAERPLFHRDRLPQTEDVVTQTSFAPEPTNTKHLQLKGVIRKGGTSRAYVEVIGGEPVWLKTGESLAGWTLKRITDDGVMLSDGSRNIDLPLHPSPDR